MLFLASLYIMVDLVYPLVGPMRPCANLSIQNYSYAPPSDLAISEPISYGPAYYWFCVQ